MTEMQRLLDRLFPEDGSVKLKHLHISWGPEAYKLTVEERAAQLNKIFDQLASGDYEDITDVDDCGEKYKFNDNSLKTNILDWTKKNLKIIHQKVNNKC